jgi:DNA-binding GntR family transcriptional regulator
MASTKRPFTKASDTIRQEIEASIKSGALLPGDAIDEAELARVHAVSRTPIREALIQLQAQGMLTSLPRGGMLVAKMDLQQLLSLWELLAELEGLAARLACQRMTPDELAAIVDNHRSSEEVVARDDMAAWQQSNLRFHELIYRATRNPYLRQEVLRIRTRTGVYRQHAFAALGAIRASYEQHARVVAAFEASDPEGASAAMVMHMRPARDASAMTDFIVNLPKDLLAS